MFVGVGRCGRLVCMFVCTYTGARGQPQTVILHVGAIAIYFIFEKWFLIALVLTE